MDYPIEESRIRYNKIKLEHSKFFNSGIRYIHPDSNYSKEEIDKMSIILLKDISSLPVDIQK